MGLFERINEDLKQSMKNKDSFRLSVIRMLKGAVQLEKINQKKDLEDADIVNIIVKQIKMRKDSINEFKKANRNDLVEQYENEITVLNEYMPEQLSEDEVINIINDAFTKINPTSNKDMGLIMKEISPKIKGKADMSFVSEIIKNKLNN